MAGYFGNEDRKSGIPFVTLALLKLYRTKVTFKESIENQVKKGKSEAESRTVESSQGKN